MQEFLDRVQSLAEIFGPNPYLQAAVIAVMGIIAGKIADVFISRLIGRLAQRSSSNFDDDFLRIFHRPVFITFVLIGLGLATIRLQMPDTAEHVTLASLKTIAILIWLGFMRRFVVLLLAAVATDESDGFVQSRTVPLIQNVAQVLIIAIGIYVLFLAWNIDVTAWLASAGIVGLALSFAARDTLANLFAGVSILADAPYKIGDTINLESGERGMVTHIGLRSTRLLTRDDIEITVPNGNIGSGKIINEAGGPHAKRRIRIKIGVSYGSDLDKVIEVLQNVAAESPDACDQPPPRVRLRQFGDSALHFELLCWIENPLERGRVSHELHCAVYKAFENHGIQIPFPQQDIYMHTVQSAGAQ